MELARRERTDSPSRLIATVVLTGWIPSSELVGWKCGSVYSIVFFIRRKDLAKGDFRNIGWEITN